MRRKGFTLTELMVAMGLLIVLGLMLISVLRSTLSTWRHTEERTHVYRTARETLALLRDDLNSLYIGTGTIKEVVFLIDRDKFGRQRLRFIRKIKDEQKHPILRHAASGTIAEGHDDYFTLKGDRDKRLRAPGGLAEVIYCLSPTPSGTQLWRGVRSPIGGPGSFFGDDNVDELNEIKAQCHEIADGILHFGLLCWGYNTTSWEEKRKPDARAASGGGPSRLWDSTRTRLPEFYLYFQKFAPSHPKAVYPTKLRLALVQSDQATELVEDISETDVVCRLKNATGFATAQDSWRFVRIDDEWMSYAQRSDDRLLELRRGIWGTEAVAHPAQKRISHTYYEEWDVEKQLPKTYYTWQDTMVRSGIPLVVTLALPLSDTTP